MKYRAVWTGKRLWLPMAAVAALAAAAGPQGGAAAQEAPASDYRVLATNRTSTMERELNEAAQAGFRFVAVMGGETAGGNEVVVLMSRRGEQGGLRSYRLLATNRTSTMQKELQAAADEGFEYRGQTIFRTMFGGEEVVCILERDLDAPLAPVEYRLLATTRTSTLERELTDAAAAGFEPLGLTVASTAVGGQELVVITRRSAAP